jgi:trk system potassium uptake protein TrkA
MKKFTRSALIIGLGRFGSATAKRLAELGWDVVGVDKNPLVVQHMSDYLTHVLELDAADEDALATVGVADFSVCIVSRGESVESSILLVLNLQNLGARRIVAKAISPYHAKIIRRLGVEDIIFPEMDAGRRLAETLQAPHLTWWTQLDSERLIGLIKVPKSRSGSPLDLWEASRRPSLAILAHLDSSGKPLIIDRHAPLKEGEILLVSGLSSDLLAFGQ